MCGHIVEQTVPSDGIQHVPCPTNTFGSKIRIKILTSHPLPLSEVEVFGETGKFILTIHYVHLQWNRIDEKWSCEYKNMIALLLNVFKY